jgi:hypothetical protein
VVWTRIESIIWSLFTVKVIDYRFRFLQSIRSPSLHIPNEVILDVVDLVAVLHNFLTLFLYKVLDKSVSGNGNPKSNVVVMMMMMSLICSCRNKK